MTGEPAVPGRHAYRHPPARDPSTFRVTLQPLDALPVRDYERLVGRSFFASRAFVELWRTMGGRAVAWTASADGEMVAVLPGVEYGLTPILRFASMPDGCYGGVFVASGWEHERAAIGVRLLDAIAAHGYAKTAVFDFEHTLPSHPAFDAEVCECERVDISQPGWQPPDPKLRSEIRKAERERIAIQRFDWALHHERFLELVATTARRHGQRMRYRRRFYQVLAQIAERDPRVHWLYCESGGRPVASQIYFIENDMLQLWQSYYDKAFSPLKANQYMSFTLSRDMARASVRWLNLGATPSDAAGVEHFKSRWGGSTLRFTCYTRVQGLGVLARALAR